MTHATPIILSHESALAFWRQPDATVGHAIGTHEALRFLEDAGRVAHIRALCEIAPLAALADIPLPLDLLTSNRDDRRQTSRVHFHCMQTEAPDGALFELGDTSGRVAVSSPEFCFVQMASVLSLHELILLGFELCGSYAIRASNPRGHVKAEAVTTPGRLFAFAQRARNMTGAKAARRAAKWILSGARSPKEAKICMVAHLPRSQGGMGANTPLLSQELEAPDPAARMLGARLFTPALFWPDAHIAVEFSMREWAAPEERANYDKLVRNAYRLMGVSAISLGKGDLMDAGLLRKHFDFINRRCKKRLNPPNEHQRRAQEKLLALLVC